MANDVIVSLLSYVESLDARLRTSGMTALNGSITNPMETLVG